MRYVYVYLHGDMLNLCRRLAIALIDWRIKWVHSIDGTFARL